MKQVSAMNRPIFEVCQGKQKRRIREKKSIENNAVPRVLILSAVEQYS
jgi:hypothetical protein